MIEAVGGGGLCARCCYRFIGEELGKQGSGVAILTRVSRVIKVEVYGAKGRLLGLWGELWLGM